MIDIESRAEDLLNPCKFGESLIQQAFVQSVQSTYSPNQQIIINLNNNETVDLSNCYVEFDMSLTNQVAQAPLVLRIIRPAVFPPADTGTYEIFYKGIFLAAAVWNQGGAAVAIDINGNGVLATNAITVTGVGANVNTGIDLSFLTNYPKLGLDVNNFSVNAQTSAGAIFVPLQTLIISPQVLPTPRLEKTTPIINKLAVSINSETVIDVQNANRLMAFIQLMDVIDDKIGKGYESSYEELGTHIPPSTTSKLKIDLSFIDLFKIILPLELFPNPQIQINLTLEDPRFCLICSTAGNTAAQSYTIQNVRLQYHKIVLTPEDKNMINTRLNSSSGLIIPFKSWAQFNGSVGNGVATANITFNPIRKHFLGIGVLQLSQTYYGDATNVRKLSTFLRNSVDTYRLKVGNLYFPLDRVNSSNVNFSLVEPVRTLVEFCEVVKNKRIVNDMELLINYDGNYNVGGVIPQANNPSYTKYYPAYDEKVHTTAPIAILCSDVGYSNLTSLCNRLTLQGVDTGSLSNVTLELNGLVPTANCDVLIFSYAQEYLQFFKTNRMNWFK